jgi:hypothetical protein
MRRIVETTTARVLVLRQGRERRRTQRWRDSKTHSNPRSDRMKVPRLARLAGVALLALGGLAAHAQEQKHDVTQPEIDYQAGTSPLAGEPMYQSTNPKAPPMTQAEFELGRKTHL